MKRLASAIAAIAVIGTSAFAADMAVKAPPPAPVPVPTWTGFYGGIQFGGGWSGDQGVNFSPNDPLTAGIISGTSGVIVGQQPFANNYSIQQSGLVGGFEAGYNWQAGSSWLLALESDFSFSGMSGTARGPTSNLSFGLGPTVTQLSNANERTDWFGTVRGRVGWLATPNLLLFGTGGFAYGRVADSASYVINANPSVISITFPPVGGFGAICFNGAPSCFTGSSSAIRTGWAAGGGAEWLFDQHWSAKIEYQFVDLGTNTVRVTALATGFPGLTPASFNVSFHNQFNVVRVGLNYQFH